MMCAVFHHLDGSTGRRQEPFLRQRVAWLLMGCLFVVRAQPSAAENVTLDGTAAGDAPEVLSTVLEHHHVLPYYVHAVESGLLRRDNSAVVLHIDSHADMGVPKAYGSGAGAWPTFPRDVEASVEINDFLLQAVHLGIVGHIIFVEPPWARQFRCCFDLNETFTVIVGRLGGELVCDVVGTTGSKPRTRESFSHIFWKNEPKLASRDDMEDTKEFRLTLVALEDLASVAAQIDPKAPLILDIDEDVLSTESPGAIGVRRYTQLPDAKLTALWHLIWDSPLFGQTYLEKRDPALLADHGANNPAQLARSLGIEAVGALESSLDSLLEEAIEPVFQRYRTDGQRRDIARRILATAPELNRGVAVETLSDALMTFIEQPFYIAEQSVLPVLADLIRTAVSSLKQVPSIVHLVRSPEYCPPALQPVIECLLLRLIQEVYPRATVVQHDERLRMDEKQCEGVNVRGQRIDLRGPASGHDEL
eukprot:TRINITY_DN90371_c0_g1_i1.p1 TRINITY_DN90371_c0_g1~~TRINITY_DN90371_c0_g1_i1.p1  ORF type:complete len:476 (+),score=43.94 TRINITY_DN90371_c0_g1_i1:69-1496(+)